MLKKIFLDEFDKRRPGLSLISVPTGSGKSYSAVLAICDDLLRPDPDPKTKRQIIFCSNRKATSTQGPYRDLEKLLKEKGREDVFEKKVLALYADADTFRHFFADENWETALPAPLRKKEVLKRFKTLKSMLGHSLEDEIVSPQVGLCKQTIRRYLAERREEARDAGEKKEKAMRAVLERERAWLRRVMPSYYMDDYDVVFSTFQKLYHGFDGPDGRVNPILSPSDKGRDRLFLFDEFDATKRELLGYLTDQETVEDLVGDFRHLLPLRPFSKSFKAINDRATKLREEMEALIEKYWLDAPIRLEGFEKKPRFLFRDDDIITTREAKALRLVYDAREGVNRIVEGGVEEGGNSLIAVLNQLAYYVDVKVPNEIRAMAEIYMKAQKKRDDADDESDDGVEDDFDDAVSTVMSRLHLPEKQREGVRRRLRDLRSAAGTWRVNREGLRSLYERGFAYFAFNEHESHREDVHVRFVSMRLTPEQALLSLARRHRVVAISATAEMAGLVFNYDLEFLRERLGEALERFDDDAMRALERETVGKRRYDDVRIEVRFWGDRYDDVVGRAAEKFGDRRRDAERELRENFLPDRDEHEKIRVLNLFRLLTEFAEKSLGSFVWFGNELKTPGEHGSYVKRLLQMWLERKRRNRHLDLSMPSDDRYGFFEGMDAEDWPKKRADELYGFVKKMSTKDYRDHYAEHTKGRFFAYTTYPSLKEGANLHFAIDENDAGCLACTRPEFRDERKQDVEAIYLEKPTHFMDQDPGPGYNLRRDLYLLLAIHQAAEERGRFEKERREGESHRAAALRKKREWVRAAFEKSDLPEGAGGRNLVMNAYREYLPDLFALDVAAHVMQTVGRICRASYKRPVVRIWLDEFYRKPLARYARSEAAQRTLHLPEFEAILEEALKEAPQEDRAVEADAFTLRVSYANAVGKEEIGRMLEALDRGRKNPATMSGPRRRWEELRALLAAHPTLSSMQDVEIADGTKVPPPRNVYAMSAEPITRYGFHGAYDGEVEKAFAGTVENAKTVSDELLRRCCEVEGVEEHLKREGWAVAWEPGRHILSPVMFNNVYKGALGETVGAFLIEEWFGLELVPLDDDEYELFDAKDGRGLYVDFKHYGVATTGREDFSEEQREKIVAKLDENPRVERLLLVNLTGEGAMRVRYYDRGLGLLEGPRGAAVAVVPNLIDVSGERARPNARLLGPNAALKRWLAGGAS